MSRKKEETSAKEEKLKEEPDRNEAEGEEPEKSPAEAETPEEDPAQKELEEAQAKAELLKNKVIVLQVKCGDKGRLYGSVTAAEVAEALEKQHGIQADRRKLDIGDPIREIGVREITIWLYSGITTKMKLNVVPMQK